MPSGGSDPTVMVPETPPETVIAFAASIVWLQTARQSKPEIDASGVAVHDGFPVSLAGRPDRPSTSQLTLKFASTDPLPLPNISDSSGRM